MSLTVLCGEYKRVNHELLLLAANLKPSLIVDCMSCANPHKYIHFMDEEALSKMFIVETESLYRFKPAIYGLEELCKSVGAKSVFVTTYYHLFDFSNSEEQRIVVGNCWSKLQTLSKSYPIFVGLPKRNFHRDLAEEFADEIIFVEEN